MDQVATQRGEHTWEETAQNIGVSPSTLSQLKNHRRRVTAQHIAAILVWAGAAASFHDLFTVTR